MYQNTRQTEALLWDGPHLRRRTTALDPASLICALTYHHQEVFADLKQDDL